MPKQDQWDWPFLVYVGTKILGMSEAKFWKTTPRKFKALVNVHIKFQEGGKKGSKKSAPGYIDQVI